jgi:uncharacterized CHY-type Zn-finger protein
MKTVSVDDSGTPAAPSERPRVLGVDLDSETRCAHYRTELDVIAIKTRCCGEYYACKDCHDALADHELEPWPRQDFGTRAILCGVCGSALTIDAYLASGYQCPACGVGFNPGCSRHHHFYFSAT